MKLMGLANQAELLGLLEFAGQAISVYVKLNLKPMTLIAYSGFEGTSGSARVPAGGSW